ncbi:hypothetical protein AgCh_037149 [Apium graveolens]
MDKENTEHGSTEVSKKRTRGTVVQFQVDINIESWDVVNQGLKEAIWDDIKNRWKLDESRKKNVLERAGGNSREISDKAKVSQSHNEHVHYLGPGGYAGKTSKWCVDDPITSLNDSESVDPSIITSERTRRGYDWVRARTKPKEDGGYYFPNEKTKEGYEIMEHEGRVRGVGGGAEIRDVFGSGKNKHSGVVSFDELATITQEITKKKNEVVRSSFQLVDREDHLSNLQKGRVVVARGTIFPTNSQGNMIHNNPIASQNVKVYVDEVLAEYQLTPLPVPCDEHETIGNAVGSFVQWSKELVMLGQILLKQDKSVLTGSQDLRISVLILSGDNHQKMDIRT